MTNKHKNISVKISLLAPFSSMVIGLFFSVSLAVAAGGIAPTDVIALVNDARAKAGLSSLTENAMLAEAARAKANDMLKNDYFAHTSPDGVAPWHWIKQAGYRYKAAGENLAINFDTAKEQHNAWMKSTTHRANILNTQYQEIGVAVVKGKIDGQESTVTVEFFGTPFYAVADRTTVPPIAEKVAEIQGVETQAEATMPEILPTLPANDPLPEQITAPAVGRTIGWLDNAVFSVAIILLLSTLAAPFVFLIKAYHSSIVIIRKKRTDIAQAVVENMENVTDYQIKVHGLP